MVMALLSFHCAATFALGDVCLPRQLGLLAASLLVGCVCMLSMLGAISHLVCPSPSAPFVTCAYVFLHSLFGWCLPEIR